ncbi:MAG: Hsp20/alpha crystallin family protein [Chloroflexaceae bacterium]|nr:Hsp20/alpha crystallin family protein [Chloroflexaceae bacterium]
MGDPQKDHFHFVATRHTFVFGQQAWQPSINIYETSDTIQVEVDLAGVQAEQLQIDAEANMVRIHGSRQLVPPAELQRIHWMEIPAGPFQIEIPLSVPVNPERTTSHYVNGILKIVLPLLKHANQQVHITPTEL